MKTERSMTELVAAIRGGDQDAFTELYERTSQEVYRTARAVLRNEDEALDVQQDTFVYAFRHLDQLSEPEKVRSWLRSIAVNRAKTLLRRNTPVLFTELENDEGEGLPEQADLSLDASPELSLERKETAELVNEILGELSDGQRAAVAMYYYEQMSVNEIAESLGVNVSTVGTQLFRGRKKIEEAVRALEKKGVKLYGLSPVGFLVALMKRQAPTAQAGQAVLAKTLSKAGLAAGTKTAAAAGAGATAVPVAETVVLQATRPFFSTIVGKVVLGVLCAGVIGGGIAGYNWAKDKLSSKSSPILNVETAENLNTTMPTIPMEVETTAPAAPETTEYGGEDDQKIWGQCGENLYWTLFKDSGTLTLKGSGDMTDYSDAQSVPWDAYRNEIMALELPDKLTGIGGYAFANLVHVDFSSINTYSNIDIRIMNVTRIGNHAFEGCAGMTDLLLGDQLTELGDSAFARCASLESVVLRGELTEMGQSAFSDCSALREIWILNPDCKIGANAIQGAFSELRVCGFPGSTAEQLAQENGYRFDPIVDSRDSVIEEMKQSDSYESPDGEIIYSNTSLHYNRIIRVGTQYLTQVMRSEHYLATEEELQQARQAGTIVLLGEEFAYTESREQLEEWRTYQSDEEWEAFYADAEAWILKNDEKCIYCVRRENDGYCFVADPYYDEILLNYTPVGWLLLDDDNLASVIGDKCAMADFYEVWGNYYSKTKLHLYYQRFLLTGEDVLGFYWASAGR